MITRITRYYIRTKFQQGNVMEGEVKTFMNNDLADPYLPPSDTKISNVRFPQCLPPVWFFGIPPIMEAKHYRKGASWKHLWKKHINFKNKWTAAASKDMQTTLEQKEDQHLLVVFVVQAVGSGQSKSVANLRRE